MLAEEVPGVGLSDRSSEGSTCASSLSELALFSQLFFWFSVGCDQ